MMRALKGTLLQRMRGLSKAGLLKRFGHIFARCSQQQQQQWQPADVEGRCKIFTVLLNSVQSKHPAAASAPMMRWCEGRLEKSEAWCTDFDVTSRSIGFSQASSCCNWVGTMSVPVSHHVLDIQVNLFFSCDNMNKSISQYDTPHMHLQTFLANSFCINSNKL